MSARQPPTHQQRPSGAPRRPGRRDPRCPGGLAEPVPRAGRARRVRGDRSGTARPIKSPAVGWCRQCADCQHDQRSTRPAPPPSECGRCVIGFGMRRAGALHARQRRHADANRSFDQTGLPHDPGESARASASSTVLGDCRTIGRSSGTDGPITANLCRRPQGSTASSDQISRIDGRPNYRAVRDPVFARLSLGSWSTRRGHQGQPGARRLQRMPSRQVGRR